MILDEAEAKTKWCPFARAAANDEATSGVNRRAGRGTPDSDCYCLGSDCMAWTPHFRAEYPPLGDTEWQPKLFPTGKGSCGLARG